MNTVNLTRVLNIRNRIENTDKQASSAFAAEESKENRETDRKVQRILNKLKSGKKLSPAELEYLEEKAPEVYKKALKITRERIQLEETMKNAKSREAVNAALSDALNAADALSMGDAEETMTRINQYTNAFSEIKKTGEYQKLPDKIEDEKKEKAEKNTTDKEKGCSFFLYGKDMDLQEKEEEKLEDSFYAKG